MRPRKPSDDRPSDEASIERGDALLKQVDGEIAASVEQKSYKLADEAIHMIAASGARTRNARRAAFEAWVISKLAALEVLVEQMGSQPHRPEAAGTRGPVQATGLDDVRN